MAKADAPAAPPRNRFRPAFLRAADRQEKLRLQVTPKPADTGVVVIRLYDVIDSWGGSWGISAKEVAEALDTLGDDITEVRLHINSPGGEAHEGIAILNLLRQHKAKVIVTVDGLAASAASLIAMAGDEVVMSPNSEMMIHDASGGCWGTATDMHEWADVLDHLSANIASAYAARAGGTAEQWRVPMLAETWYSAQEAVDAGLADRVGNAPADDETDGATAKFDTKFFAYAGRADAPAPKTPTAPAAGPKKKETKVDLTDEQVATLRTRLGITDEIADGDTLVAAIEEALDEQTDDGKPKAKAAVALPEGMVAIEADVLAQLRSGAVAGEEARKEQQAAARKELVNAAVKDGRISPARAEAWTKRLEADPDEAEALAKLEPGLVPTAELGHAGDGEDDKTTAAVRETPAYKNWSSE